MRCGAVRCGAVRCGAVRCGAVRCGAVRCGAVRCGAVRCGAVRCGAVRCGAVRYGRTIARRRSNCTRQVVGDGRNVLRERDGVANIAKLAAAKPLDAHHRDGWLDERELELTSSSVIRQIWPLIAKSSN